MVIKLEQMNAHAYSPRCVNFGITAALVAGGIAAATAAGGAVANSAAARRAENKTRESLAADRQAQLAEKNNAEEGYRARRMKKLEEARQQLYRKSEGASGQSAVSGASNAEVAAAKETINEAYADMVSNTEADAEANAERVRENADANIRALDKESRINEAQASLAKQQAVIQGAQGVANAAGSFIASNYDHGGTTSTNGGGSVVPKNVDNTAKIQSSAVKTLGTPKFSTSNAEIQGRLKDIYTRGGFKINQLN